MLFSCSTSCIPERDPESVVRVLPDIDTDCFELFLFNHWSTKELHHICAGYPFFSVHGSKKLCFILEEDRHAGETLLKEEIILASTVEASTLVLHSYNSLNRTPDLNRVAKTVSSMQEVAEEYSVSLSLELIPHVTISIPALAAFFNSHLEDPHFTIDLEYTSKYRCLDEVLTYAASINNVHVRDYNGEWIINGKRNYLKPLDGTLDFDAIFSRIAESHYNSTYTLEAPHKTVEEINTSMRWLRTSVKTHTNL